MPPDPGATAVLSPYDAAPAIDLAARLVANVESTVRGKPDAIRLALTALLGGGHLLIEDLPGTGKTLLAKSLAVSIGGTFGRVQCTPDLLPADLTGTSVYQPGSGIWDFRQGPVFANVVLVDEINRASPRTQAALLEPMEEHQVTVDGTTHALPEPFMCIATQNPLGQIGTFPLPESQLDRFALTVSMGLPGRDAEREIITGVGGIDVLDTIGPVTAPTELTAAIDLVRNVYSAPMLVEYLLDLVAAVRANRSVIVGPSPRASSALLHLSRAHAVIAGRNYVTPDDVQFLVGRVFGHRVVMEGGPDHAEVARHIHEIAASVAVPRS